MAETCVSRPRLWERLRFHLLVGVLAILIFAFLIVQFLDSIDGSSEAKYSKLKAGMTVDQVQTVFGRPASSSINRNQEVTVMTWNFDDADVTVMFNADMRVAMMFLTEKEKSQRSLMDIVRSFLSKLGL
ncbi:MAG TPA: DUF3862 domain-containing protein [Gemmataceae bacterium]|jgi:hypothetical protein|nr:DUF3862 domain-containing protein [Gemmataceae bacterium]